MNPFRVSAAVAALFALALSSGARPLPAFGDPPVLYGTSWQLVRVPVNEAVRPADKAKYTVAFGADGRVSVRFDCNRGAGPWKSKKPGQIEMGPFAMTRAMCPPLSMFDRLAADFPRLRSYRFNEGHLFLSLAPHVDYEFEPLEGPPSFDCAQATGATQRVICADTNLAWLDRKLDDVYSAALKKVSEADAAKQRDAQTAWTAARDACASENDAKACIQSAYQRRIAELEIRAGMLPAPARAKYACPDNTTITADYYNQTDPASALFAYSGSEVVAIVLPSGSGARYGAPGMELWEHQGEAAVTWSGKQITCKVAR